MFIIFSCVLPSHSMETGLEEAPKQKVARYKVITHAPEGGAIVPQGQVIKNNIVLDIGAKDPFERRPFKSLIEDAFKDDVPFILAMVTIAGGKNNERTIYFYPAQKLNNFFNQNKQSNRYNKPPINYKDPSTNQVIIEPIKYFTVSSLKDKFEYLGTDFDMIMGEEKVNNFMLTYFNAANGNVDAQSRIAYIYYEGLGVLKNINKSIEWYKRAASKGNAKAQATLGVMYSQGKVVPQDKDVAIEWLLKAAEQNNISAQVNLGTLYEDKQDYKRAFEWYNKAAQQGNVIAQYNLALLYYSGNGIKKNLDKAIEWLSKAAEQGDEPAQEELKRLQAKKILEQEKQPTTQESTGKEE